MFLEYGNTKIFYTAKGTGKPLVLLHGFLESSSIWNQYLEDLALLRQVICIDLLGHGQSGTMGHVHSMNLMADVVNAVLDHLSISKACFAGHSMGGYVVLSFLEQFPTKVQALILINSTPEKDSEERIANRERAIELIKKNKRAFVSMAISNLLTPENNKKYKQQIDLLKEQALQFSPGGITASIEGMKIRTDKKELLKNYQGEKFMVIGRNDPVLHCERAINVAKRCDCKYILTDGGHMVFLENPAEVREILKLVD